jgi:hypothetical protein
MVFFAEFPIHHRYTCEKVLEFRLLNSIQEYHLELVQTFWKTSEAFEITFSLDATCFAADFFKLRPFHMPSKNDMR